MLRFPMNGPVFNRLLNGYNPQPNAVISQTLTALRADFETEYTC